MKNTYIHTREKGFIAAATLILMMASLGVIVAMIYRSAQGNLIATKLKQSNQAYQAGDASAEALLQSFRLLDGGTATINIGGGPVDAKKMIPENTPASSFCVSPKITCYAADKTVITNPDARVSDIFQLSAIDTSLPAARAVQVLVPIRLVTPTDPIVSLAPQLFPRRVVVTLPSIAINPLERMEDSVEIRRAQVTQAQIDAAMADLNGLGLKNLLANKDIEWRPTSAGSQSLINPQPIVVTDNLGALGSGIYLYTYKLTNFNPLRLDSGYAEPQKIVVP